MGQDDVLEQPNHLLKSPLFGEQSLLSQPLNLIVAGSPELRLG